jgi:purine-binding chemotaxis protein CheW
MAVGAAVETGTGKYLTFKIATEEFCIEIIKVQEIIGIMNVTRMPKTPDHVRGVINLRGKVIPVIDLRLKFGLDPIADTDMTCIIVVQTTCQEQSIITGIIVDQVYEVLDIEGEKIEDPPSFGTNINTSFILGMGKVAKKVISLLDIDRILIGAEIMGVEQITQ